MSVFDETRIKRITLAYRCIQIVLLLLLAVVAFMFQTRYPGQFFISFVVAVVAQGVLLYPVYRLAWRDAGVELDSCVPGLTAEQLLALRKKRLFGDLWKASLLVFFLIFVARIPDAQKVGTPFFLSTSLYSFLLILLTYFQCFNYSIKKRRASM